MTSTSSGVCDYYSFSYMQLIHKLMSPGQNFPSYRSYSYNFLLNISSWKSQNLFKLNIPLETLLSLTPLLVSCHQVQWSLRTRTLLLKVWSEDQSHICVSLVRIKEFQACCWPTGPESPCGHISRWFLCTLKYEKFCNKRMKSVFILNPSSLTTIFSPLLTALVSWINYLHILLVPLY